jgi:hypothetical protein
VFNISYREETMEENKFSGIKSFDYNCDDDGNNDYKHEWDCYCDVCCIKFYYLEGEEVTKEEYLSSDFHKTEKKHYLNL